MKKTSDNGFALIMVLGMTVLFLILGGTTAYLVFRAQQMSSGLLRYNAAIDAADAAQDLAAIWIRNSCDNSVTLSDSTGRSFGSYTVSIRNQAIKTAALPGSSREFGSGYEGRGNGGEIARYYRIVSLAVATGLNSEQCRLETLRRKLIRGE